MLLRRLIRALVTLAALAALGGALLLPTASVAWPRYRVWAALPFTGVGELWKGDSLVTSRPAGRDPWGRPWAEHRLLQEDARGAPRRSASPSTTHSVGPDGVDDGGAGDDVPVDGSMELVRLAPQLGALAALGLLWLAAALRSLGGGRGPEAWHDAVRAGIAASVPAAGVAIGVAAWGAPTPLRDLQLLVPVPVALVGAAWLVLTLAVLGWRVRRGVGRRRRGVEGRVLGALVATLVGALAAADGLRRHGEERRELRSAALTRVGHRGEVERVLRGDLAALEAYLALDPEVEWQLLSTSALTGVAQLGSRAAPYLARALRGYGPVTRGGRLVNAGVAGDDVATWHLLRARDAELRALAEAFAAEPDGYADLFLANPRLLAALVGAEQPRRDLRAALEELERREAAEPWSLHVGELMRQRVAREAALELLEGEGAADADVWLVVDVLGLVLDEHGAQCALALDDEPATQSLTEPDSERALVVLGPTDAAPASRRLVVADVNVPGRSVTVALPAQEAHTTLWVEVDLAAGRADVRPLQRPATAQPVARGR